MSLPLVLPGPPDMATTLTASLVLVLIFKTVMKRGK